MAICDGGTAFSCSGTACGYDSTQEDDGLFGAKHIEEKPLKARPSKKLRKGSKRRIRDLRAAVGDAVADADDAGHGLGPARSKQQQQRQESRERASRLPPRLHRAIRYRASMLGKFAGSHAASGACTAL